MRGKNTRNSAGHWGVVITLALLLLTFSCSPLRTAKEIRWSQASGTEPPALIHSESFQGSAVEVPVGDKVVSRSQQRWHSLPVEGGYLQKISDAETGELLALHARTRELERELNLEQIQDLTARTDTLLENLKSRDHELKKASEIFKPQWTINPDHFGPAAYLKIAYIPEDPLFVRELKVSPSGQVLARTTVSKHLAQGVGRVFPEGPLKSQLADVPLQDLLGTGDLSSPTLTVTSESREPAFSPEGRFTYEPGQDPFEQVQTFYHIRRMLEFYKTQYQVNLPFALEAKVFVGYPKKKNVAFYYDGKIRIGAGDDVLYTNMPVDPSIVMHEAAHAYVQALAGLGFEDEEGSINEGFADFLAANVLGSPRMADASYLKADYKRSIRNELLYTEQSGGLYHDSLIVSGLLWQIRQAVGVSEATTFALETLSHLGPGATLEELRKIIQEELSENENPALSAQIAVILEERQWL